MRLSKEVIPTFIVNFIKNAIDEDIGTGDITTNLTIDSSSNSVANVVAKDDMVLAGIPFFEIVYDLIDSSVVIEKFAQDGDRLNKGSQILKLSGKTSSLLMGERLALNILQRLSGIATLTNKFKALVEGCNVTIVDTRKTTPNMRFMEKYGVRAGGGQNHRFGLYDGILIKDNHIAVCGGIKQAIEKIKKKPMLIKVEVEVKNLDEVKEALKEDVDVIMLDNMSVDIMKNAVEIIRQSGKKVVIEASGNVSLENVSKIAKTGVDVISIGSLTHSVKASDISMNIL